MPVNIVCNPVASCGDTARNEPKRELSQPSAVGLVMMKVIHKLAVSTGSDERAVVAGILSLSAAVGGAVLFQAIVS
jgi:hypothetical protein